MEARGPDLLVKVAVLTGLKAVLLPISLPEEKGMAGGCNNVLDTVPLGIGTPQRIIDLGLSVFLDFR